MLFLQVPRISLQNDWHLPSHAAPKQTAGRSQSQNFGSNMQLFLLTNPDPRCYDSLVIREDTEKFCTLFPGEGLQTLLYTSLPSVSGFEVALLLFKPRKL